MAIDFPSSPTDGQKFIQKNVTYTWVAAKSRWDASVQTALPFNYFINPSFQVSQQNGNTAGSTANYYAADQYYHGPNHDGVVTVQRMQIPTPRGSPNRLRLVVTTADTALAASQYQHNFQYIEGNRIAPFGFGTANAKQLVLRFGWKSPQGTYSVFVRNGGVNRTYLANFTISAPQHYVETEQIIVIPGDTAGTWLTDVSQGMSCGFCIGCGTSQQGTAGIWNAVGCLGTASNSNGLAFVSYTYEFFDLGLYLDPNNTGLPPPWEYVSDRQALFDCQRYWQRCSTTIGVAIANTATPQRSSYPGMAPLRAIPANSFVGTMRGWDQATAPNLTSISTNYSNTSVIEHNYSAASAQTTGRAAMVIDVSPLIYMAINARL